MKLVRNIVVVVIGVIWLFPFVFLILGSTNHAGWAYQMPIIFRIGDQFAHNFNYLNNTYYIYQVVRNSMLVSFTTAMISIIIVVLASYAFSKYQFRYKKTIFILFISALIIPQISTLVGNLKLISTLGLYGTVLGLILPFVVNVRTFYYLINMFQYVPNEVIESAKIDGAKEVQVLTYIGLPIIMDKIMVSFFMLFVASWNNFLIPMIMMSRRRQFTLPVMLSSLSDPLSYNTGSTLLALLIATIPVIVLYLMLSKDIFKDTGV